MFHDNDRKLVVNLDYQLVKKESAFIIPETLFIRCCSNKYQQIWDNLLHNIMTYIIALTHNSLSQSNFKREN